MGERVPLPRISQMTLMTAYYEVTMSPMNTGEYEPQAAGIWRIQWGEACKEALRVDSDSRIRLEFHGAAVTGDVGLIAFANTAPWTS